MKQNDPDYRRENGKSPEEFDMDATAAAPHITAASSLEVDADPDVISLRAWKNGDIRGYNNLVKRYERRLLIFIHRMIRDEDDAKDLLQETFVRLYRSLDKLREDKSLKSWLYRTANNVSIDWLRKHKPGRVTAMDQQDSTFQFLAESSDADGPRRPDDQMRDNWIQEKILEAIDYLPGQQKMAMTLRSVKGLSLREIAELMNSTEQTVGTTLFAARKKLIKILQPVLREECGPLDG
ncbi:MAG: sigma-70 family RNA polymerase sigma factor [Candidatus Omnitrophica bacterium]|nr:sigma-70 family RNA polymerase sigma factor [Candidatus Omnitrophota bacterium]